MKNNYSGDDWDKIVRTLDDTKREELWRAHLQWIYAELFDRWGVNSQDGLTLKTDLYDEAITTHNLMSFLGRRSERVVGTDISLEVARAAKRRMAKEWDSRNRVVVSDIRNLAFRSECCSQILSNSTLDHFPHTRDIVRSLKEIHRILKPGGTLVITLDNPANPLIFLRNRLPYRLLRFFGIIPFYMGRTLSRTELARVLEANGFKVQEHTSIVHSPRIVAIWLGYMIEKTGSNHTKSGFRKLLQLFERLESFPVKDLTGHFVAAKAIKTGV